MNTISRYLQSEDISEEDERYQSGYTSLLIDEWFYFMKRTFPSGFVQASINFSKRKIINRKFLAVYKSPNRKNNGYLYASNVFLNQLKRMMDGGARKIVTMVNMHLSGRTGHANAILIDNNTKTVSVFEPNGYFPMYIAASTAVANYLSSYLKDRGFGSYTVEPSVLSCPRMGPQALEHLEGYIARMVEQGKKLPKNPQGNGFCAIWSLMYIHYHLLNEEASNGDIQRSMIGDGDGKKLEIKAKKYLKMVLDYVGGFELPKFVEEPRRRRDMCNKFIKSFDKNPTAALRFKNPISDEEPLTRGNIETVAEECRRIIMDTEGEYMEEDDNIIEMLEDEEKLQTGVFQYNSPKAATCIRTIANVKNFDKYYKFDNENFNPSELKRKLDMESPKAVALMDKIRELDEADMMKHGKKFKHFIFSDIRQQGAKFLVGVLQAYGFNPCIRLRGKTLSLMDQDKIKQEYEEGTGFVYLLSSSVYGNSLTVGLKKSVLQLYNKRPDNVYGELARIIVLDSGFKEGIDLFDVKYVHIFEPSTTRANLRQTIGRATRFCGQAGLPFDPLEGWKLMVFLYDIEFERDVEDIFKIRRGEDIIKRYILSDPRVTEFEAELEKLSMEVAVDRELNQYIHNFSSRSSSEVHSSESHVINPMVEVVESEQVVDLIPQLKIVQIKCSSANRKCGKTRATKSVPLSTPLFYILAYGNGYVIPGKGKYGNSDVRQYLCNLLNDSKFCEQINRDLQDPMGFIIRNIDMFIEALGKKGAFSNLRASVRNPMALIVKQANEARVVNELSKTGRSSGAKPRKQSFVIPETPDVLKKFEEEEEERVSPPSDRLPYEELNNYIREKYMHCMWPKPKMENQCVISPGAAAVTGPKIVTFTPTQEFIRTYFTPENPYKGMLIQHGVGCGKTCTAIATATSSFDRQGYTILWVTRSSLKSDLYKNMFDLVCNAHIREMLMEGKEIPTDQTARLRLLGKPWSIPPISYKQFSNLVEGKNEIFNKLVRRNGEDDPLRKTLIIIDEAHKLYGGDDISGTEKPNMEAFYAALMNSYSVSGVDSARVMLMTATPYTSDPMEFFKLINLIREPTEQLPTVFEEFSSTYLNENGGFTEEGRIRILDELAGQISYLSRQNDARQFASIHLHHMLVNQRRLSKDDVAREIRRLGILIGRYSNMKTIVENKLKAEQKRKVGRSKAEIEKRRLIVEDIQQQLEEVTNKLKELSTDLSSAELLFKNENGPEELYSGHLKDKCLKKIQFGTSGTKPKKPRQRVVEPNDETEDESGSDSEGDSSESESDSDDSDY